MVGMPALSERGLGCAGQLNDTPPHVVPPQHSAGRQVPPLHTAAAYPARSLRAGISAEQSNTLSVQVVPRQHSLARQGSPEEARATHALEAYCGCCCSGCGVCAAQSKAVPWHVLTGSGGLQHSVVSHGFAAHVSVAYVSLSACAPQLNDDNAQVVPALQHSPVVQAVPTHCAVA